jgi:methyl-accepting chemotaxis protein
MTLKDHSERRQFGRRNTYTLGHVQLPGRRSIACIVRNMSEAGALLMFERPEWLPFGFFLTLEGDNKKYACEVRHHYGERVGIEFVDAAVISPYVLATPSDVEGSWIAPNSTSRIGRT